jgi:polygalacturonase
MTEARIDVERRAFVKCAVQAAAAVPFTAAAAEIARAQSGNLAHRRGAKGEPAPQAQLKLNVRDYGVAGAGKTKDTQALQLAIERCSVFGGGEVVIPAGDYLTGALALRSNVLLRLEEGATLNGSPDMADYPVAQVRWEGRWIKGYSALIFANDAENIGIVGPGKIVGSPAVRGRVNRETRMRLPALLEFVNCRSVRVENCYTENFGMWSIHPTYCQDVSFRNVTVKSGADGIDVDSCRNVTIDGCDFDTTDDCISLKSGRGAEGYTILRPTEDVRISNCSFRDKVFACIGIGSETSGGIRNVHVDNCKCLSAGTFAIYIKSRPGRGAFIENIYMNNLEVSGAKQGFLRFNILNSGIADEYLVPGDEGIPTIRNFEFRNIKVTDEPVLVDGMAIHPHKPLDGFVLENVTGTCGKGISLANITHARIANVNVSGVQGPLLSIHNVTGKGLQGAVQIDGPKVPEAIQPPTEPYKLH